MDADELREFCRATVAGHEAAGAALRARLDAEGRRLLDAYDAAFWRRLQAQEARLTFELRRHLPHLATVLRTLDDHINESTFDDLGRCCRD